MVELIRAITRVQRSLKINRTIAIEGVTPKEWKQVMLIKKQKERKQICKKKRGRAENA